MALRGDLVGEAFVRITADTTAMRQAIRRAGNDITKFNKQVDAEADAIYRNQRRTLARAFADPKEFDRLAKRFNSVEEAATDFRNTLDHLRKTEGLNKKSIASYTVAINRWEKSAIDARKAAFDLAEQQKTLLREREHERAVKAQAAAWATYGRNLLAADKIEQEVIVHRHRDRWDAFRNATVAGLDKAEHRMRRFNDALGASFGRGSRNNFFNWLGSMVRGISMAFTSFPVAAAQRATSVVDKFFDAFGGARGAGFGKLASSARGLLAVFSGAQGLIGAFAGLAVGAIALAEVLPGIVSLMSLLAGVVSALVGSISIGLTGALLALGPVVAGALAGVGAVATTFIAFFKDSKNKKFVQDFFKPFKDVQTVYYPQIKTFLTTISSGFDDLIKDMRPSVNAFFSLFAKGNKKRGPGALVDPSTLSALGKLSDSIGRIATSLTKGFGSLASGLLGFFVPVLPYAERLANYLRDAFATFDKWANNKEGQQAIAGFMDKAWVAAGKLWRILGNIAGIIGKVFMGGENAGTTLLDRMLQKLQEINAFLSTPEGKRKMSEWFGDVESIGTSLGQLATDVGRIIKNLNSPEGRANAKSIMEAIVRIGDTVVEITKVADQIARIVGLLNPLKQVMNLFRGEKASTPTGQPQTTPALDNRPASQRKEVQSALSKYALELKVTPKLDQKALNKQLAAIEAYKSTGVEIPVKGNEDLWEQTKGSIAQTIFKDKSVPVKGNETAWNKTKGTIAAHVFKPKVVPIYVEDKAVTNWIAWWNRVNLNKTATIRYTTAGRLPNGGRDTSGGSTSSASGRVVYGPHMGLVGEAGPEAIVPLDRPLHLVDPAVRALSAFAQGKGMNRYASGGIVGGGRTINVHPGAIVVQSPHADPALVAEAVVDRLVAFA